jgi:predicted metal-dependent HD superfamily phosphohydrolase
LKQSNIELVKKYIAGTMNHTQHASDSDRTFQLFLDFDFSILGCNRDRYKEYSKQIRHEYNHIPLKEFCEKRSAFLENIVNSKKQLYYTETMTQLHQEQAIENIKWEVTELKQIAASIIE